MQACVKKKFSAVAGFLLELEGWNGSIDCDYIFTCESVQRK
jgi:hypothetical protein